MKPFPKPLQWLEAWAVASQQRARRNAMIATTALAHRRAELLEVEEYLAGLHARTLVATGAVEPAVVAARG